MQTISSKVQIFEGDFIKRLACLVISTLLFCGATTIIKANLSKSTVVYVAKMKLSEFEKTVEANGVLVSNDTSSTSLDKNVLIKSIYVKDGEKIKKGQKLGTYSDDLISAMSSINGMNSSQATEKAIIAQTDGTVKSVNCKVGEILYTGVNFVDIICSKTFTANINIDESDISKVKIGQKVNITGIAFPGEIVTGTVSSIDDKAVQKVDPNSTIPSTKTVIAATININDSNSLREGYNITADIIIRHYSDTMTIPYEAVNEDQNNKEYVYFFDGHTARKTYISTIDENINGVVIEEPQNKSIVTNVNKIKSNTDNVIFREVSTK